MMQAAQREAPNMKGREICRELAMGKTSVYCATGIEVNETFSVNEHFMKGGFIRLEEATKPLAAMTSAQTWALVASGH
jgi:hypothetical protein